MIRYGVANGLFYISSPYNPNFISSIKGIPGARFGEIRLEDGSVLSKVWTVPEFQKKSAMETLLLHYPGEMARKTADTELRTARTPEEARDLLANSDDAVEKALLMLYENQEDDEKAVKDTVHVNGMGFNKPDSGYGSFLAQQVQGGKHLTAGQTEAARGMLYKYKGQLVGLMGNVPVNVKKVVPPPAQNDKNCTIIAQIGTRQDYKETKFENLTAEEAKQKWTKLKDTPSTIKLIGFKDEIQTGEWTRPARFTARLDENKEAIIVDSQFEDKDNIKAIPGATWDSFRRKWKLPLTRTSITRLQKWDSDISIDVMEAVANKEKEVEDLQELAESNSVTINHPAGSKLRDFQRAGVSFLKKVPRAILGDDMGLGKSLEAMVATSEIGSKKILVIVPNSLKRNWYKEYLKWEILPEEKLTLITGDRDKRKALIENYKDGAMIINYDHCRVSPDENSRETNLKDLLKIDWDTVIVDEAHKIKHRESLQTQGVQSICHKAKKNCILLTGTPPGEVDFMWPLLNALQPEKYPSFWKFVNAHAHVYKETINRSGKEVTKIEGRPLHPLEYRKEILDPIMIRRLKSDKLKDLPPKQYREVWVELEPEQRKIYNQMVDQGVAELGAEKVSTMNIITLLNRLRQIAVSPDIMTPKIEDLDKALKRSSKMKAMMDILEGTAGKVVVFSQYERAVSLACRAFEKASPPIEYVRYTGEENEKARNLALEKFSKDPDVKVMIMTTSAGGLGLTLTEAPDAIFLDKMWNPEDNVQAEDRIHRMGQLSDNIVIHEILAENTLDEWVENILNTKTSIDASVMDMMNKYHGSELIQVLKGVSAGKGVPTNLHTLNTVNHMKVKPQLNLPKNPHKQTYEGIQESK